MTEQKELPPTWATLEVAALHFERVAQWLTKETDSASKAKRVELCKFYAKQVRDAKQLPPHIQPAEDERVKEIRARYDSWRAFKCVPDNAEVFERQAERAHEDIGILLSLLPVQPAQQDAKDAELKAALEDFRREMEENVIPAIENDLRERAVLADDARRRGPLFGTTAVSPVVEEMRAAIKDPITPEGIKGCYQRAVDEIQRLTIQPAASTPTGRIVDLSQHGEPTRDQLDEIKARVADGYDAIFKQKDWSGMVHAMLGDLHFLLTFFKDAHAAASTDAPDERKRDE